MTSKLLSLPGMGATGKPKGAIAVHAGYVMQGFLPGKRELGKICVFRPHKTGEAVRDGAACLLESWLRPGKSPFKLAILSYL